MSTTRRQIKILVLSIQTKASSLDAFESSVVPDELCNAYDDHQIGSEKRQTLARNLRTLRSNPEFRILFANSVRMLKQRIAKDPQGWRLDQRAYKRLHPQTVTRKATPAKRHPDCLYCGRGMSFQVCGVCKAAGIDGKTIPGTSARKASTYIALEMTVASMRVRWASIQDMIDLEYTT